MPRASLKKQLPQKEPLLSKTQKTVATIISCLLLAGMVWNGISSGDARYAKEQYTKDAVQTLLAKNEYLENRIDIVEIRAKREKVQFRLWDLEKEFKSVRMPDSVLKQKIELEKDLKNMDEAVDTYEKENIRSRIQESTGAQPATPMTEQRAPSYAPRMKSTNPYLQRGN